MPKKLTKEEFVKKANNVHSHKYGYLKVDYVNSKTKVSIICSAHGEFKQTPNDHLIGHGCKKCGYLDRADQKKDTLNDFIGKANKIHNNFFNYGKVFYVNSQIKITIICPIHGEFRQTPYSHLAGKGCRRCSNDKLSHRQLKSFNSFIEKATEIHNNKYDYSKANYINRRTKIEIICKEHGVFLQTPHDHLSNHGCSMCKSSNGEHQIKIFLDKNNINYNLQEWFKATSRQCINPETNTKLMFDFYLPDYNLCIEFDGVQHFRPIEWFGGDIAFKTQIDRDQIKTLFCKENNIKLLRIPYFKIKNIEKILYKEIYNENEIL